MCDPGEYDWVDAFNEHVGELLGDDGESEAAFWETNLALEWYDDYPDDPRHAAEVAIDAWLEEDL